MKHFGEDFGQKVDLTASIRGILRNYPEGTAVFKELIQNADDAGARSISLCLDCRHHGAAKLADAALAQFQGPSLLVYNDAMFTKEDFQSIQRIGDSLKNQTESSKTKIGRFGIGFNAVYHWTELPTFISDRFLVMLDPQARFLPNVNPANPGKIVDWLGNTSVLTDFSDQFSPFAIPGIDWSHRFEGTLFRLPLRTEEQASSSLLSKRSLTTKQVEDILVSLAHEATSMLLFLRSIEKITIQIWNNDSSEPSVLFSCGIANVDSSLRNQRSFDVALGKQRSQAIAAQSKIIQDCVLQIEVIDNINGHSSRETWNVCNQFGGDEASKLVAHPTNSHLKLVPVGGVAVKLSDIDEDAASRDGFAYCFLPLPVRTGLPVMINGFFELSSNRRDIWQESSDMTGDGSLRARWNVALLRDVIAPCYARLICSLRDKLGFSLFYQSLWPKWDLPLPWCYLGNSTLQELATKPLLKLDASPSGAPIWIESTNAVVLPTHLSADEKKELSVILKHLGSHVVTFSDDELHRSLIVANITKNIAIPSFFRSVIKQSSTVMIPSMCKASLAYCLSDQHTSSLSMEMDGLRLLPMKDGTVGRLRVLSSAHKASVDALISMGFSVQSALGSLLRHNFDVDRSWEFLTLPTSVNGIAWRNEGLCILPSPQDNLEIFEKAYHIIIDQHAIGANELEFLSSSEQMQFTNIRHFEFAHIPDLLLYVFPPIFSDKMPVVVDSLDSNIRQYLLAYLPRFWKYLESHPKAITALYENIPVLPTNDFMEICPISRLSNVISSRKGDAVLSAEVLIIVRSLGVRTLDVTAGDLNAFPPSLWDYIFSPNSPGILGALEFSYRNLSDVDSRLQRLSSSERDHLRGVLIEKQGSVLSSQNRDVLNRLPVWKLAKSKSLGEGDTPYTALSAVSPAIVIADSAAFPSVVLPSHAIDCESEKAWNLLKQLQVQRITKSEFLQRYFFPNVVAFHKKHKSEVESFLLTIFLDFRAISLQDRSFGDFLKTVPCILNAAGEMKMIGDLYDPSEREILELMGDIMLPDVNFRQEEILVTLKHLGLRTAIDLSSLLQCARAVEAINDETQGDVKLAKARALLKYLDHNLAKLFGEDTSKKSAGGMGFFSNISSLFVDKTANKAEISLFKSELKRIAWLPVMIAPPVAYIPWVQGQPTLCAPPEHCASVKDMWYCSATSRIMEERISSQTLISTLGIDQPVSIETLAIQLREIALSFKANKQNNVEPAIQDNFRMQIAEIIGHVYAQFDQATESDRSIIYRQLESAPWIWVGSDFVTVFKVARHCSVNAAPFLYQLPASMRSYQKLLEGFRVKDHFHAHDYIDALHELAVMYPDSILEDSMLEISISLVILLGSESTSILRSSEIFVPDINGRLAPAADLVNDDVPWLAGQEFLSLRASCRMVHPKISSSVAEKVGVKSLRLSLVKRNLEQNLFGTTLASGGNIESFGQAESLTNRLKTILDLYPDGSPILNELIQNADDSKATVVRIMIDENHYRSESLMDNRMEAIQGPALVVQNDSEFSEADFRNLASVGQGSKLEKLATTGRFGLGFNSTYHITDTPTFVSGEHFVFFDPHCAFVPGATMNQPGMRIRYTKSDLNVAFADQFAPYKFYGFDFSTPYRGTMFRFPLRGFSQAKRSEICKRAYQVSDVYAMIEQIGQQLTEVLMFLRSVKRIELYRCPAGSNEPILISSASSEVTDLKQMHDQDLISFFDAQSSQQMTKDQFYAKLMNIPDDKLPWTSCTKKFEVDYFTYQPEQSLLSRVKSDISSYKIIYGLCGGSAKRLACREEARHLKLIPFGSVSACIQRQQKNIADDTADNSHLIPPISGQLFCFLPLPIRTSLPVHVNAYWELSSNRRDIWRGDDTKGEAKLRSDWNACIMKDVVSVLYARLLMSMAKMCQDTYTVQQYDPANLISLLPCPIPPQPWNAVADALFPICRDVCMLWTNLDGGKYVSARSSFFLPQFEKPSSAFDANESTSNHWLEELMLMEGIPVVSVPSELVECFVRADSVGGVIDPKFIRKHFNVQRHVVHKCLLPGAESSTVHLRYAAKLLTFACEDLFSSGAFDQLHGLELLPLQSGKLGVLGNLIDDVMYFLASDIECKLLANSNDVLVADRAILGPHLLRIFDSPKFSELCNVRALQPIDFLKLLSKLIPKEWLPAETVVAAKTSDFTDEWISLLWSVLLDKQLLPLFIGVFPIIPILPVGSNKANLAKILPSVPILPSLSIVEHRDIVIEALSCVDIFVFDNSNLSNLLYNQDFSNLFVKHGAVGILDALMISFDNKTLARASLWASDVRRYMETFVLDNIIHVLHTLTAEQVLMLQSLPIWPRYSKKFVDNDCQGTDYEYDVLTANLWLPHADIPVTLLNENFIAVRTERDRSAYAKLGAKVCSLAQFTRDHIIPAIRLKQVSATSLVHIRNFVLDSLPVLEADSPDICGLLSSCPLFVGAGRDGLISADALYDPLVPMLRSFLPKFLFPSDDVCSNPTHLHAMRRLGLRRLVNCADILTSARDIQEEVDDGSSKSVSARSAALMTYLNSNIESLLQECDPQGFEHHTAQQSAANAQNSAEAPQENDPSTDLGGEWASELRSLSWVIALTSPPSQFSNVGLPWPSRIHSSPLAAPVQCGLPRNIWLISSSMRISTIEATNPLLQTVLEWNKPVPGRIIALQLLSMSEEWSRSVNNSQSTPTFKDKLVRTLDEIYPVVLARLYDAYLSEPDSEKELWTRVLTGKPILWMASGRFVEPYRAAFQGLLNLDAEPFLCVLSPYMVRFRDLLLRIGAKESFSPVDLAEATRENFAVYKNQSLPIETLEMIIGVILLLYKLISSGEQSDNADLESENIIQSLGVVYAPDSQGILAPIRSLVYNDAPWIVASLGQQRMQRIRMINERIDVAIAQAFGGKSLRALLFAGEDMLCPSAEAVLPTFRDSSLFHPFESVMALADKIGAKSVDVIYDERSFSSESLLHPGLSSTQGPSLVMYLDGTVIDRAEISRMLIAPAEGMTAGFQVCSGPKLVSCFMLTDCLQILSGNEFFIFDPSGDFLISDQATPSVPSGPGRNSESNQSKGKRYQLDRRTNQGEDQVDSLFDSFADQFEPFLSLPLKSCEELGRSKRMKGVVVRLPLRARPSTLSSIVLSEESLRSILGSLKDRLTPALLFGRSLERFKISHMVAERGLQTELEVGLTSDVSIRNQRLKLLQTTGWEKQGLNKMISKMFNSAFVPPEQFYPLRLSVKVSPSPWIHYDPQTSLLSPAPPLPTLDDHHGVNPVVLEESWIIGCTMGQSPLRDAALSDIYRDANLLPFVSMALQQLGPAHLSRHDIPPVNGLGLNGAGLAMETGLPFHVEAQFIELCGSPLKKGPNAEARESERIKTVNSWNIKAIATVLSTLYPSVLMNSFKRILSEHSIGAANSTNSGAIIEGMYKYWIYSPRLTELAKSALRSATTSTKLESVLSSEPLYLAGANTLLSADKAVFSCSTMSDDLQSYLQSTMELARCPSQVGLDLQSFSIAVTELSPARLRSVLKKDAHLHMQKLTRMLSNKDRWIEGFHLLLELIETASKDLVSPGDGEFTKRKVYRSLQSIPLLLMADRTIRLVPVISQDQVAIVNDPSYLPLLPPTVLNRILHPVLFAHCQLFGDPILQETLNIVQFGPKFINDMLSNIMPAKWRNVNAVTWSPSDVANLELLLYLLWNRTLKDLRQEDLQPIKDFAMTPVLSRERRVLLNAKDLLFLFVVTPSRLSNERRGQLRERVTAIQQQGVVNMQPRSTVKSSWEWTKSRAGNYSQLLAHVNKVNPQPTAGSAAEEGEDGGDLIEMVDENAEPQATGQTTGASLPTAMETDDLNEEELSPNNSLQLSMSTFRILEKIGFPFLDADIFEGAPFALAQQRSVADGELVGRRLVEIAHHFLEANTHVLTANSSPEPLLSFDELSIDERIALLREIFEAHSRHPFDDANVEKVKLLPLFIDSADSSPVTLVECTQRGVYWCSDRSVLDIIQLSLSSSVPGPPATAAAEQSRQLPVILINHSSLMEVYRWLQIVELTAPVAMTKFVVPVIKTMNSLVRFKLLRHLAENWSLYRAEQALVNVLKECRFVPSWTINNPDNWMEEVSPAGDCNRDWRKISDVLSWTNNELMDSLKGSALPKYFAPPAMQRAEYHVLFTDLGMSQEMKGDIFLRIVEDIQADFMAIERSSRDVEDEGTLRHCRERGRAILQYMLNHDAMFDLFGADHAQLRRLGQIRFVPIMQPTAVEEGGYVVYRATVGSFSECAARSHGALAFSVMAILDEDLTPHAYVFSHLGIVNHPIEDIVLRHLRHLMQSKSLDRWNAPFAIIATFNALFTYLQDRWNNIPVSVRGALKSSSIIPIGHALVAPNRVYFRLSEDLSPFMYELPRHFGAHETLLKQLGVMETPLAQEYMHFLQDLSTEMADHPLNPNELRAVITIAQTIVSQLEQQHLWSFGASSTTDMTTTSMIKSLSAEDQRLLESVKRSLFVPDEQSIMRRLDHCVIGDSSELRQQLGHQSKGFRYYLLHPWMHKTVGHRLLLLRLSEVVVERMDFRSNVTQVLADDIKWREAAEQELLHDHVPQTLQRLIGASKNMVGSAGAADSYEVWDLPAVTEIIKNLQLVFASRMTTMCVVVDPSTGRDVEELTINRNKEPLAFLDRSSSPPKLFINISRINATTVTLELALAWGLCDLLSLSKQSVFVITQVLSAVKNGVDIYQLLDYSGLEGQFDDVDYRGIPGRELSAVDLESVELRPFRTFRVGELVAIEDDHGGQKRLIYGKVVSIGDIDASGLCKLDVRIGKGTKRLLATDVFTFRSARAASGAGGNAAQTGGPARAIAATPPTQTQQQIIGSVASDQQSKVGKEEVISAVKGLLHRAGLPIDIEQETLMARILDLEAAQRQAEEALQAERLQTAQVRQRLSADAQRYTCSICLTDSIQRSLVPCGHSFCEGCVSRLPNNRCPVCRTAIQSRLKLFLGDSSST